MPRNINGSMSDVNIPGYLPVHMQANTLFCMSYGSRLKAAREYKGLSQAQLAKESGISQPSVSHLENPANGAEGSDRTVQFARACGVSPDWLADATGPMLPHLSVNEATLAAYALMIHPRLRELVELAGKLSDDGLIELVGMARMLNTMADTRRRANPAASSS